MQRWPLQLHSATARPASDSIPDCDRIGRAGVGFVGRAGLAALTGGLLWVVKGGIIMLGGAQPPWIFEFAPGLFSLGLLGLRAALGPSPGRAGIVGGVMAYLTGGLWAITMPIYALVPGAVRAGSFGPVNALILVTFLTNLSALVLLGIAARRCRVLPPRWSWLPIVLGTVAFPLIVAGGALAVLNQRLVELPVVVVGAAWMLLGYLIWARRAQAIPGPQWPPHLTARK